MNDTERRSMLAVATVYGAALLQGMALVSFPALASVLREIHQLTDAQYGSIFLPMVGCAAVSAIAGGVLARQVGLRSLLVASLVLNAVAQCLTVASVWTGDSGYERLLLATGCMGLGFGLLAAPMNGYPPLMFPRWRDTAVVIIHTTAGVGLTIGPIIAARYVMRGFWLGFPYLLIATALALALLALFVRLPRPVTPARAAAHSRHPVRTPAFWLFVTIGVLYSIAEGMFGNWAVVYLHEDRALSEADASAALSAFWGALVVGRLVISALIVRIPADRIWQVLPVLMIGAYLLMPQVETATGALATLAFAGFACSAFFPLAVARAVRTYPDWSAFLSSLLVAALMIGVGIGSYTVGPLRDLLGLAMLYQLSALFPLIVFGLVWMLRSHARSQIEPGTEALGHGRA